MNRFFNLWRASLPLVLAIASLNLQAQNETNGLIVMGKRQVMEAALMNNRQLQIERIQPDIARRALSSSYGFYDPVFQSRVHTESSADTGGFDPADFSADAVFSADSEVISLGLLGFLPSGLTYTLGGNYAHSEGTRNFLNFDSYKLGTGIYLEQPLLKNLWIDQPRWIIQVNRKNLKISELGVKYVGMTVMNLTLQGYYDLIFAWDNLQVYQDLLQTRAEFLRGIRRQIELGMMTVLEEKLAQSQASASETDLIAARSLVALASNNLKTLMGFTGTNWTSDLLKPRDFLLLEPRSFQRETSWMVGLQQRPDLLQLAINLENAELTVKYRKNQLFPSLNLIGSYGLKGSDAIQAFPPDNPKADIGFAFREIERQSAENSMIGLLFSVPLTMTSERANYKMSKELKAQAALLLKQKEELVLREIADANDMARFSFDRADSAQKAAQFAQEALKAEEERYRGGTGSIFLVLQAQTEWARSKIAELSARRDYNKALSQLYFSEGTLLERHFAEVQYR